MSEKPDLYYGFEVFSTDRNTEAIPLMQYGGFGALSEVSEAINDALNPFREEHEEDERSCGHRIPEVTGLISRAEACALALAAKTHGGEAVLITICDDIDDKLEGRPKRMAEALRYVASRIEAGTMRER